MFWPSSCTSRPTPLAISTVLTRKRVSRRKITWVQLGYVAMIPIGAYAFCLTSGALEETLKHQLTGFALAFSAGTFIFIALSDLLPEVQFHRHDRVPLFLTLVGGVLSMGFIAWLESLAEGKEKEESTKAVRHGCGCAWSTQDLDGETARGNKIESPRPVAVGWEVGH